MHIFKDRDGTDWELSVSVQSIKRVRAMTAAAGERIDLLEPTDGDKPIVDRLTDPIFVADICWCLVKLQADAREITDEEFGELLIGPAIGAAMDGLYEELIDFFRSIGRTHLAQILEAHRQIVRAIVEEVRNQVQTVQRKNQAPGSSSTDSPESSESTPTRSPSDSSIGWPTENASTNGTEPASSPAKSTATPECRAATQAPELSIRS